jgi:hypothetical protein
MNAQTVATGARLHGAVMHVITKGMAHDVSACGRVVTAGKGAGKRVCRTCVRINGDAFKLDAAMRKAERELRMSQSVVNSAEIAEEFISWEFQLNAAELEMTREKIEKINTRCANRGIPGGLNVESREETRKDTNALGIEIERIVYMVKITGIAPKLPDWEFMATLDYDQYAGLIVRAYPGMPAINRDNLREGWCDHCQTNRYRKTTYVMRNKMTGEEIQVGSACIKDFTGWTALPYTFDRMTKDVEEFSGGFGSAPRDVTVLTALAISWACVTEYGFVKSREENSTAGMVRDVIDPPKPNKWNADYIAELQRVSKHSEEMYARAEELRAWILDNEKFPLSDRSDYAANLKAIASAERVSLRQIGILASAPQAWAKWLEKSFIKERESAPESNWFGEITERWEMSLTLKAVRYIESAYGCSTLHTFTDESGNVFKWFASSSDLAEDYDGIGKVFRIAAGIKSHGEFRNVRETGLTRAKVIESDAEMIAPVKVKDAAIKAKDEMRVSDVTVNLDSVYFMNGAYFKIRTQKGIAYAVKHTGNGWEYANGAVRSLTDAHALTADQATQFGHDYRQCVFCSRPLTDERSMTAGYGETCAHTHALPWGE